MRAALWDGVEPLRRDEGAVIWGQDADGYRGLDPGYGSHPRGLMFSYT